MTTPPSTPRDAPRRISPKFLFWIALFLMAVSVFIYTELPYAYPGRPEHAHLVSIGWLIIPHFLGGLLALLTGPIQFSTRFRKRHLSLHRLIGRVYVFSVFTASFCAFLIELRIHYTLILLIANLLQTITWFLATLAALLTARNRHIQAHRQWMIRSYAITFTFILLRLPNPWPPWAHMGGNLFALGLVVSTFLAVFIPDLLFNWREYISRRHP